MKDKKNNIEKSGKQIKRGAKIHSTALANVVTVIQDEDENERYKRSFNIITELTELK